MSTQPKITAAIAGTGNACLSFLMSCNKGNVEITHLWGRDDAELSVLSNRFEVTPITDVANFNDADILILAVSDDAIPEVAEQFKSFTGHFIHLSGSKPADHIENRPCSVVWPILSLKSNSFSKNNLNSFSIFSFLTFSFFRFSTISIASPNPFSFRS